MPFIAITERASARLVNEQYEVLERGVQVHERLERLVIEGRGLEEILASTGAAVGGTRDRPRRGGRELARSAGGEPGGGRGRGAQPPRSPRRGRARRPRPFAPSSRQLAGRALAVPVPGGAAARRSPGWP